MSVELAKEMASAAYDILLDVLQDYILNNTTRPAVIHVSASMEKLLITHYTLNCNYNFPPNGVRGLPHIMGMRLVFDAPYFKLEADPEWNPYGQKIGTKSSVVQTSGEPQRTTAGIFAGPV